MTLTTKGEVVAGESESTVAIAQVRVIFALMVLLLQTEGLGVAVRDIARRVVIKTITLVRHWPIAEVEAVVFGVDS